MDDEKDIELAFMTHIPSRSTTMFLDMNYCDSYDIALNLKDFRNKCHCVLFYYGSSVMKPFFRFGHKPTCDYVSLNTSILLERIVLMVCTLM